MQYFKEKYSRKEHISGNKNVLFKKMWICRQTLNFPT